MVIAFTSFWQSHGGHNKAIFYSVCFETKIHSFFLNILREKVLIFVYCKTFSDDNTLFVLVPRREGRLR